MNRHLLFDDLTAAFGGLYGENMKFFSRKCSSGPLTEIVRETEVEFTPPTATGEYRIPVRYGEIEAIARYSLLQWTDASQAVLIFHHGSGETDYTGRVRKIFSKGSYRNLNLIAVSVPFNSSIREYLGAAGSLEEFAFLFASSVRLTEALVSWLRNTAGGKIVCAGISLGGWITNLHFSVYGSCDEYRPIFAGAAPDHLFTDTVYRKLLSKHAANSAAAISSALNFEKLFRSRNAAKVFPLMGRFDQYIRLERQAGIYQPDHVTVIEKGHISGSADYKAQRRHLLEGLAVKTPQ